MGTWFGYTLMTEQSGPRELVRYAFGGGWNVNADLPTTAGFATASQFVLEKLRAAAP